MDLADTKFKELPMKLSIISFFTFLALSSSALAFEMVSTSDIQLSKTASQYQNFRIHLNLNGKLIELGKWASPRQERNTCLINLDSSAGPLDKVPVGTHFFDAKTYNLISKSLLSKDHALFDFRGTAMIGENQKVNLTLICTDFENDEILFSTNRLNSILHKYLITTDQF